MLFTLIKLCGWLWCDCLLILRSSGLGRPGMAFVELDDERGGSTKSRVAFTRSRELSCWNVSELCAARLSLKSVGDRSSSDSRTCRLLAATTLYGSSCSRSRPSSFAYFSLLQSEAESDSLGVEISILEYMMGNTCMEPSLQP